MPTLSGNGRYLLDGSMYVVDPQAKLGAGAEGMVIEHPRDPRYCVKLFHPPDPMDKDAHSVAAYRGRKVRAICGRKFTLPAQFALPMLPVFDMNGRDIIGYEMQRVPPGYDKLMQLLKGSFRASHQLGLRTVSELFADIFDDLELVHSTGLVVGDINLGCVMFQPGGGHVWVDTDSWSYPGFPCLATSELFAHPDLYVNLVESSTHKAPEPRHDRFSFLVAYTLLAIPGAHPFKMGRHPTVKGLQNRANAGITIFDADIEFPPALGTPEVLSDDLLHELVERLKRRNEQPLDPNLLRAFAHNVATCKTCDTEYHASRKTCPKCHKVTTVQVAGLVDYIIAELFKTPGVLLFAQLIEKELYLVCRIGTRTQIIRIDEQGAATVLAPTLSSIPGARYRFFSSYLVVCPTPAQPAPATLELYRIEGNALQRLNDTSTGVFQGKSAVFDTSSRFLYRTASNALVRSDLFGPHGVVFDTHVAEVHQRQSWFTVDHSTGTDREVVFGCDQALRNWEWFVILGNAKGSQYQYHRVGDLGLCTGETVEDFTVYFSASSVLLVMITSYQGRDYARYALIGLDGTIHLNRVIDSSDDTFLLWSNLHGKLHQGRSVLHVTLNGIVKQVLADGTCTTLAGTQGRLTMDDQLLRLGGKVGIARRGGISIMTGKK